MTYQAAGWVILAAISYVIRAIDRPKVSGADFGAAPGTVPGHGHEETAFARLALPGVVEERQVQDRHLLQDECGAARSRAFAGRDDEALAAQLPPRLRHLAIRDEALVQHILFAEPLGPTALEVKRIVRCKHARLSDDVGVGLAGYIVELTRLFLRVVNQVIAPDSQIPVEVVIEDVAVGAHLAGFAVILHLVGAEEQVTVLDFGRCARQAG